MNTDRKLVFDGHQGLTSLDDRIERLGEKIGPDIGKRRPQNFKDLWVALNWVRGIDTDQAYGIRLFQGESPDFIYESEKGRFGLEVTEAANSEERKFNIEQKHSSPVGPWPVYQSDHSADSDISIAVKWCIDSIKKKNLKVDKYQVSPCDLVIYFNSLRLISSDICDFVTVTRREVGEMNLSLRNIWIYHSRGGLLLVKSA